MEHLDDGLKGVERRGDSEGVSESKQIDFRNASDAELTQDILHLVKKVELLTLAFLILEC